MKFEKHVFICTNQRAPGERRCCGEGTGLELVKLFKQAIKEQGLKTTIRAQRAGCLDSCDFGPSLVVYPEGIYYGGVTPGDVNEIVMEHLVNNRPVSRLVIQDIKP